MARPRWVLAAGAGIMSLLAASALWLGRPDAWWSSANPGEASAGAIYTASFSDLDGNAQVLGRWQHKLLIINFWATWCGPCKEEMPVLAALQQKYANRGLQVVGIAVDSRANVANFAQKNNIGYPLLPDEVRAMEFSRRLGNRAALLPYSVVVQPGGEIAHRQLGALHAEELESIVEKNLPKSDK